MSTRQELAHALRALTIDAIEKSQSGHPGAPLGMADMAEALWRGPLKHNPANPVWPDRDRFVLSNGHASMLLYGLLHLTGYDMGMHDIEQFRQLHSRTPGHPEIETSGVEVSTGPLASGLATAVGLALAERMLAAQFNRPAYTIVDHRTWVFVGDGCLMEGLSQEACSLAGTLGLGKLIVLYDQNHISIDGPVKGWFTDDTPARFEACGWHVIRSVDGHSSAALDTALTQAMDIGQAQQKPCLICCNTTIAFGSPHKAGSASSHGAPLGAEEAAATKKALGWTAPPFTVPDALKHAWDQRPRGASLEAGWNALFAAYQADYPDLAAEFLRRMAGDLPTTWQNDSQALIAQLAANPKSLATRVSSKECLEALTPILPEMVGGSADLSGSVGTWLSTSKPVTPTDYAGNYIHYGVREFLMGAMMNGFCRHGGFLPYAGTFLVFSDYARAAIRLAALMHERVVFVLTHDSIGVGEDGPTHQPVEHVPSLRLIPNVDVWRPADSAETAVAWVAAVERRNGPTCLSLSRQNLPAFAHPEAQLADIKRGGYILRNCPGQPDIILIATGSEVALTLAAADNLPDLAVRVVSMPCCEVFDRQDAQYRAQVLPPSVRARVAVEAARSTTWWKYVGLDGQVIAMDSFGCSAPSSKLFPHFGFSTSHVVEVVRQVLAQPA